MAPYKRNRKHWPNTNVPHIPRENKHRPAHNNPAIRNWPVQQPTAGLFDSVPKVSPTPSRQWPRHQPFKPTAEPYEPAHHTPANSNSAHVARRCARLPIHGSRHGSPLPPSNTSPTGDRQAPSDVARSYSPAISTTASSYYLPRYWTYEEEQLMRRTARDYDLILAYPRDSSGGERWHTEDIAEIRTLGQNLHGDRRALNLLQRNLATSGEDDEAALANILYEKDKLLDYCERLDTLERSLEYSPVHHLLNSGVCEEIDGYVYRVKPWTAASPQPVTSAVVKLRRDKHKGEPTAGPDPRAKGASTHRSHHNSKLVATCSNTLSPSQSLPYRLYQSIESPNAAAGQEPLEEGELEDEPITNPKRYYETDTFPSPLRKRQRVYSPVLTPPSSPMRSGRRDRHTQRYPRYQQRASSEE